MGLGACWGLRTVGLRHAQDSDRVRGESRVGSARFPLGVSRDRRSTRFGEGASRAPEST
jgi:hypothetical protein